MKREGSNVMCVREDSGSMRVMCDGRWLNHEVCVREEVVPKSECEGESLAQEILCVFISVME